MKTILLPVDFSRNSWNAVFNALKLYDKVPCHFLLLHAYQARIGNLVGDSGERKMWSVYEDLKKEAEAKMDDMLEYLGRENQNARHQISGRCRLGELIAVTEGLLEQEPVDLILMGTQGATGADRIFLGSNAVRMLRSIRNRPVLLVPGGFDLQRLDCVALPTDFMHPYEPFELQPLRELLLQWKARLHVVYIASEFELKPIQQDHRELLKCRLADVSLHFDQVQLGRHVKDALLGHSHKIRAQLIALVQHRHSVLETLVREPVVRRMAFETDLPLLVLPRLQ